MVWGKIGIDSSHQFRNRVKILAHNKQLSYMSNICFILVLIRILNKILFYNIVNLNDTNTRVPYTK